MPQEKPNPSLAKWEAVFRPKVLRRAPAVSHARDAKGHSVTRAAIIAELGKKK
jgi:hypothetical protein